MNRFVTIAAAAMLFAPAVARGQATTAPSYQDQSGQTREAIGTFAQLVTGPSTGTAIAASPAAEGARVVKAAPGSLFGLNVASGTTAGVVQVINAAAIPADGPITPAKCFYLAANTSVDLNLRAAPTYFPTGIVVVFSSGTSCFTKNASATAFISADAR